MVDFWLVGGVLGATGVGFGALGAHSIKKHFNDLNKSRSWEVASHYQILHAIPIMFLQNYPTMRLGAGLLTAGTILFSGSIYGLVLIKKSGKILGPLTPIGGLLLIAGWSTLAYKASLL